MGIRMDSGKKKPVFRHITELIWLFFMLAADWLMARSAGGFGELQKKAGTGKMLLLLFENLLVLAAVFAGPRLEKWFVMGHARLLEILDWILLAGTPVLQFFLVQLFLDKKINVAASCIWKNLLIYYWLLIALFLIFGSASLACTISSILWTVLALVEYYVLLFRSEAFTLADVFGVKTALAVAGGYQFKLEPARAALLLALVFYEVFQGRLQRLKIGKCSVKSIGIRTAVLLGMAAAVLLQKNFFIAAEDLDTYRMDSQYSDKGYAYVLMGEAGYLIAEEPEGYSAEAVYEIAAPYETQENISPADTQGTVPENVIVIMIESFADVESAGNLRAEEEILPNLHKLAEEDNVKSGSLYVSVRGGGTCGTEYEVLTGNSIQFLPAAGMVYQFYVKEPEYGLASSFKNQGYRTVAMHPNPSYAWNRDQAYSAMGFDSFITLEDWDSDSGMLRGFVSDAAVYDKIIRLYEEKEEGEKLFTFCVTIQNHGGYGEETLDGYEPDVRLEYEEEFSEVETYLSLVKESDRAVMDLLSYFETVEEPTMVVFFGDHWPQLGDAFLTLLQGESDLTEEEKRQILYSTPYVIWTNYPFEGGHEDMSANYLGAYILSAAGLELTPWQRFQLAMQEEIPSIGIDSRVETADGSWTDIADLPEDLACWISDYKILEYNNVFDRQNRPESVYNGYSE